MQFKDGVGDSVGGVDSKHLIRLKDGESISGVFRGEPYDFRQHWIDNRPQFCSGVSCPECEKKLRSSFTFRLNLVVFEKGIFVAKIFEQRSTVYKQLKNLHRSGYDLTKTVVTITRFGKSKDDTTYSILPTPNKTFTPQLEAALAKVELHDLAKVDQMVNQPSNEPEQAPPFPTDISF